MSAAARLPRPGLSGGIFLGVGLGGFFDGIVFHQLLQLHNMLSARLFPDSVVHLEVNMFWDGVFHLFCYAMTCTGILLLWRAARLQLLPSGQALVGTLLIGAGLFNFVEGLIDHQILQLHHVVERASMPARLAFDLAFLASGIMMLALGGHLLRRGGAAPIRQA